MLILTRRPGKGQANPTSPFFSLLIQKQIRPLDAVTVRG